MIGLRRALTAVAVAGIAFGLAVVAVIATSDHVELPGLTLVLALLIGWGFIGVGLFAWWRRPDNNFGPLMTSVGFLFFVSRLGWSDVPLIFAVGVVLGSIFFVAIIHMLLAMPSGRLRSTGERRLLGALYVLVIAAPTGYLLFADTETDPDCEGCPRNLLLIDDNETLAGITDLLSNVIAVGLGTAALVVLARHWRKATVPERRALAPVLFLGFILIVLLLVGLSLASAGADSATDVTFYVAEGVLALMPFVFLGAIARSRMVRGEAVSDLVARLGQTPGPGEMRDALARAVGDPSLELAYWVPETERWVDADGHSAELPGSGSGRAHSYVELDGKCVVAMIYDESLSAEGEMLAAVGTAAALSLENERLDAALRARLDELQASRTRLMEAGMGERRRLERDLHDGAQQRLVALALDLRLIRGKVADDPEAAEQMLEGAGRELEAALAELRELARGIHPAVLSSRGLGAALESLAARAPVPVDLEHRTGGPLPEAVESAAYFVVSEALANVAKYAEASHATVEVARENGGVLVTVTDDGVGGADPQRGSGLRGLSDRIEALDGRLWVESSPGQGTTVGARMPCG